MFCVHVRGFCGVELFEKFLSPWNERYVCIIWDLNKNLSMAFCIGFQVKYFKKCNEIVYCNISQKLIGASSVTWVKRCLNFLMGNLKLIRKFQWPYSVQHVLFLGMCFRVTCMVFRLEHWTMFWVPLTDALHLSKVIIIILTLLCTLSLRTLSFKNVCNRSCVCFEM